MDKDTDFTIGSLNVRGVNDRVKRKGIFDWAQEKCFDIVMLQECYCCEDIETEWADEWGGMCLFSHGSKHSKGTVILIKKGFDLSIISKKVDIDGRYIILKVIIQGEDFTLVNLYAPNTMQGKQAFYEELGNSLGNMNIDKNRNIIVVGDWNSIQKYSLDKNGGNEKGNNTVVNSMTELLGQFDLVDIWRLRNPALKRYTYCQKTPIILSRLDYFMISNSLQDNIVCADIVSSIWSDHSAVTLSIKHLPKAKQGNSHWKFNSSLVEDQLYVDTMCNNLREWLFKYNEIQDDRVKWELLKYEIHKFSMSYCSQRKLDKQIADNRKKKTLEQLEIELGTNPSVEVMLQVERLKFDILEVEMEKINGAIVRSKVKWVEEGEKSSKFFFDLEKQNYIKKQVRKLKLSSGIVTTDPEKIKAEMEKYYSKLYKSNANIANEDIFVLSKHVPKLTELEKECCDAPITIEECTDVLETFSKSKSPGNDGLTIEFYSKFWNIIADPLIKSYNSAYREAELSVSQKQALIKRIDKSGKDRES